MLCSLADVMIGGILSKDSSMEQLVFFLVKDSLAAVNTATSLHFNSMAFY
jgi:predicted ribosome-associated RNA-binding protein Tma20